MLAAINFQLRYAPYILAAKKLIHKGLLGELNDIEVNVNVYTPWHLWDFLFTSPRVEILYHSIHYIDLIRNLLGNPNQCMLKLPNILLCRNWLLFAVILLWIMAK